MVIEQGIMFRIEDEFVFSGDELSSAPIDRSGLADLLSPFVGSGLRFGVDLATGGTAS